MIKTPFICCKDSCSKHKDELDIYYPEERTFEHGTENLEFVFDKTLQQDSIRNVVFHNQNFQRNWFIQNDKMYRHFDASNLEIINVDESIVHETFSRELNSQNFNVHIDILDK